MSKRFGALAAVDDVSFDLERGELLGVAGPNGAGKTTLFSLLARSGITPDSGSAELNSTSLHGASARQISVLGLRRTFQKPEVFLSLEVSETMALVASFLGQRETRDDDIENALALTGLAAKKHTRGAELSLMDRKRLMIATAVVGDPQVLLLDEPAGGLGLDEQEDLARIVSDIHESGVSIILIEHVLPLLRRLASRLLVLAEGRVLASGIPDQVFRDPRVVEAYLG